MLWRFYLMLTQELKITLVSLNWKNDYKKEPSMKLKITTILELVSSACLCFCSQQIHWGDTRIFHVLWIIILIYSNYAVSSGKSRKLCLLGFPFSIQGIILQTSVLLRVFHCQISGTGRISGSPTMQTFWLGFSIRNNPWKICAKIS